MTSWLILLQPALDKLEREFWEDFLRRNTILSMLKKKKKRILNAKLGK